LQGRSIPDDVLKHQAYFCKHLHGHTIRQASFGRFVAALALVCASTYAVAQLIPLSDRVGREHER
jgi:hypothetical protein